MTNFTTELTLLLNKYSKENGSNTPDFILASFLISCLEAFNGHVNGRNTWYKNSTPPPTPLINPLPPPEVKI